MEQSLVENVAVANETTQGDTASGNDVVYLSELDVGVDEGSTVERDAQIDESAAPNARGDGAEQPDNARNQNATPKDFSVALNKRVAEIQAREQAKYESSDEYQFGRMMLQERAAREGITVQEARRRYENEQVSSQADEYQKNPKKFYEDFVRYRNSPPVQQAQPQQLQPEAHGVNVVAPSLARQIVEAKQNGLLPETFSPADVTPEFVSHVQQFGVQEAARRLAAPQQGFATAASIADELERRRRAPRPMRPASQGAAMGAVNFRGMTDEQFNKYDAQIEKAIMEGKRVK